MTKFEFVGVFATTKEPVKVDKYPAGVSTKINMFVKKDDICSAFMEVSDFKGAKQFDIKCTMKLNKNSDKIEVIIPYKDRTTKESLQLAPSYKKKVLDLGTDFELKAEIRQMEYKIRNAEWNEEVTDEIIELRKELEIKSLTKREFLADEDYIVAISEALDQLKDKRVRVTGQFKMEVNKKNGSVYRKFIPDSIEYAPEELANKLEIKAEYIFGEEAVNDDSFEDSKMVNIMGYVEDYDPILKDRKLFPLPLVIDGGKLDMENPKHLAYLELFKSQLTSEDGFSKLPITISYYRGGKEVDFNEDMLTDAQRAMIEAGLSTLDTYKPRGGVIGDNVEYYKLINLDLSGDFKNGAIKQFDEDVLGSKLFIFNEDVVINKKTEQVIETKQSVVTDSDVEDLFS